MARNNIKLLTPEELALLNDKYIISFDEDTIFVRLSTKSLVTLHDANQPFHINAKGIRKMCFTLNAINIWKDIYDSKTMKPTLWEVQQASHLLDMTYQEVNKLNVLKMIEEYKGEK